MFAIFLLGFTPCDAEQPLQGMELWVKEAQKDESIQEICFERTYSNRCLLILDLKSFSHLADRSKESIL